MSTKTRDIPEVMKAARLNKFSKELEIVTIPTPKCDFDSVLVKVEYCGVCHTDLHIARGEVPFKPQLPVILGHEVVGTVEEVGSKVTFPSVGDRVGIPWVHSTCGHCYFCMDKKEVVCPKLTSTGFSENGGFAEYITAKTDFVTKIPEGLRPDLAAPLLCAGVTTYKALKVSNAKAGDWVVIFGVGGLGHVAIQYANAMGMNVVAVDVDKEKLDLAEQLGAEIILNSKEEGISKLKKRLPRGGADTALVLAPSTEAVADGYSCLRPFGTLVLCSLPRGNFEMPVFDDVFSCKTITGSLVGTRLDLNEALEFGARGLVIPNVTKRPLSEINNVFKELQHGKVIGRVVIDMQA
jgi:propanol-preferring alcohol dehydrogenase